MQRIQVLIDSTLEYLCELFPYFENFQVEPLSNKQIKKVFL